MLQAALASVKHCSLHDWPLKSRVRIGSQSHIIFHSSSQVKHFFAFAVLSSAFMSALFTVLSYSMVWWSQGTKGWVPDIVSINIKRLRCRGLNGGCCCVCLFVTIQ